MAKTELTKEELQKQIDACYAVINRQNAKIAKLQKKMDEIKKAEVLEAIIKSGKTMDEILELINL